MTFRPVNTNSIYVDASIFLPDDEHQLRLKLTDSLRDFATGINNREIGQYYTNEIQTGSTLYNAAANQKPRQVFRKVIDFGALPNAAPSAPVPHGIAINSSFQILKLYAVGNNPNATGVTNFAVSIPDQNSTLNLTLTDIVITTTVNYSMYTKTAVVVEYSKT